MHLYLTYRGQVIELLYPSLATLAVVTDQLDCLNLDILNFQRFESLILN